MIKIPLILLLAFHALLIAGCPFDSQYGIVAIESREGEKFYIRREARGLNHDSLSLSKSPLHCPQPDPTTELVFSGHQPRVYYKFEGNKLHLYLMHPVKDPPRLSDKVEIVQHEIDNPRSLWLRENHESVGLESMEVPLDKSLGCLL